jgi:hypothetical protein
MTIQVADVAGRRRDTSSANWLRSTLNEALN